MTSADVSAQIASLAERAAAFSPTTDQNAVFMGPYKWQYCTFDVSFYFAKDQLDTILMEARADPTQKCADDMRTELAAHFGEGVRRDNDPSEHLEWHTKTTTIVYNKIGPPEVDLIEVGGAPLTIYDMTSR
jgi:hypothetical protein